MQQCSLKIVHTLEMFFYCCCSTYCRMRNVLNNLLKLEKNVCHKKTLHLWPGGCKMPCRQLQLSDIECSQVCGKLEGKAGSGLILGLTLGYVIFGYWPLNHLMGSRIESEKLEDWLMIDLHPKLWLSYHKRFEEHHGTLTWLMSWYHFISWVIRKRAADWLMTKALNSSGPENCWATRHSPGIEEWKQ